MLLIFMIDISIRAKNAIRSPIRKYSLLADQAKKKGIKIFHLNIGQPDLETPREFFNEIRSFREKTVAYAPSAGYLETIVAWQKYYHDQGFEINQEDIMVTAGASEAILFSLLAIADPGDEIIVFEPIYPNYRGLADMAAVNLRPISLHIENNFALPAIQEIEKSITPKTKGIIFCNPNNPLGVVYPEQEMMKIVELAKKYNLFILADEVYREMVFDNLKPVSFFPFKEIINQLIVVDSVSKKFSACGARIGCVITKNQDIIANMLKFAEARLAIPTLEQLAVIPILRKAAVYTEKIRKEYQKRRDVVYTELKKIPGVVCFKAQGAFYLLAKLPVKDSEDFVKFLLTDFQINNKTVMVTPAADFYLTKGLGQNEIRIAYVLETDKLKEAIAILAAGLNAYQKRQG